MHLTGKESAGYVLDKQTVKEIFVEHTYLYPQVEMIIYLRIDIRT